MAEVERMDDPFRARWFEFCRGLTPEQIDVVREHTKRERAPLAAKVERYEKAMSEAHHLLGQHEVSRAASRLSSAIGMYGKNLRDAIREDGGRNAG